MVNVGQREITANHLYEITEPPTQAYHEIAEVERQPQATTDSNADNDPNSVYSDLSDYGTGEAANGQYRPSGNMHSLQLRSKYWLTVFMQQSTYII